VLCLCNVCVCVCVRVLQNSCAVSKFMIGPKTHKPHCSLAFFLCVCVCVRVCVCRERERENMKVTPGPSRKVMPGTVGTRRRFMGVYPCVSV
jgi:hypothetical protein